MSVTLPEFFNGSYVDQASYDNLRKISSAVDGLKNSNRKVIHTVIDKGIKELIKVNQLASKVAEHTDYLHGSLDGVVCNLAQNFTASNQVPLLHKKGNFGTRSVPTPSASRYIYARGADILPLLFHPADESVVPTQFFEGEKIEPRFLLPAVPLLFVNGNQGVSSGFAQNIGQRDLKEILNALTERLTNKKPDFEEFNSVPLFFNGFKGKITRDEGEGYKWVITGNYEVKGDEILITELPPNTKLIPYITMLNNLQEEKKIKSYTDACNSDDWCFKIKLNKGQKVTEDWILKTFKLRTTITENFTSLGADNKIKEFQHPSEILDHYYQTKIEFMAKRKENLSKALEEDILKKQSQYRFLEAVVSGILELRKMKSSDIQEYLEKNDFHKVKGSFHYLTSLPISHMQQDTMEKLKKEIEQAGKDFEILQAKTVETLWIEDLNELKKYIKQKGI